MNLKDKVIQLGEEFKIQWDLYIRLSKELDTYRGKDLGDDIRRVNELILQIQDVFSDLYPFLALIVQQYTFANQALKDYDSFVNDIKQAGAIEIDKQAQ